jgi:hypothetical protein
MHLDFDQPTAFAIFATAAFNVETETACIIPTHARRRQLREQLAYGRKGAGVSDRI